MVRLLLGELRQGALEGLMIEAIAKASALPVDDVRRAVMMAGDTGTVAKAALGEGQAGLARFAIQLFRPIKPMLAQPADDLADALGTLGRAAFEYKLDGARVQAHKAGDEVRVFSRRLNEVTAAVPEIVEAVQGLPVREAILDGEAIALRPDGWPQPFQITMRRFGRKLDVAAMRQSLPLQSFFFDALALEGIPLIDRPAGERFAALRDVVPETLRIPRTVTGREDEATAFVNQALAAGHEGVMAKALEAPYEAGARGKSWLKLKTATTLDLVVLAAEWGNGRRQGWLSNLHLGARDPAHGGFVMLGKTFKGLTDQMLTWQTEQLLAREIARDRYTVYVRPELVVEIAFNDLQVSPHYPGGLALRFARVKAYRPDKRRRRRTPSTRCARSTSARRSPPLAILPEFQTGQPPVSMGPRHRHRRSPLVATLPLLAPPAVLGEMLPLMSAAGAAARFPGVRPRCSACGCRGILRVAQEQKFGAAVAALALERVAGGQIEIFSSSELDDDPGVAP